MYLYSMIEKIKKEIEGKFSALEFVEDTHTYNVGQLILPSVSSFIKEFHPHFDAETIAHFVAKKEGKTKAQVLKEWKDIADEACENGTRVHLFGEKYMEGWNPIPTCPKEEAVVKFWKGVPSRYKILIPELQMYHFKYNYAGTADIILYDTQTDTLVIADYKTNKDLFKNHKEQKMLGEFTHLLDSPYNKYQIQLSMYQILLEQTGYKVSKRIIVYLKDDGNYELHFTDDYTKVLTEWLEINRT